MFDVREDYPILAENGLRRMHRLLLFILATVLPSAAPGETQKAEMAGYLLVATDKVPDEFNAGFSLSTAAWPL